MREVEASTAKDVCEAVGVAYRAGVVFYELGNDKSEKIAVKKRVLLLTSTCVVKESVRDVLVIPENGVRSSDLKLGDGALFVQSTSAARKLTGRVLVQVDESFVKKAKHAEEEDGSNEMPFARGLLDVNAVEAAVVAVPPLPREVWGMVICRLGLPVPDVESVMLEEGEGYQWARSTVRTLTRTAAVCRTFYRLVASNDALLWRPVVQWLGDEDGNDPVVDLSKPSPFQRFADPSVVTWKHQAFVRLQPHFNTSTFDEGEPGWSSEIEPILGLALVPSSYASFQSLAPIASKKSRPVGPPVWCVGSSGQGPALLCIFTVGSSWRSLLRSEAGAWEWIRPMWDIYSDEQKERVFPQLFWCAFDFAAKSWIPLGLLIMSLLSDESHYAFHQYLKCELIELLFSFPVDRTNVSCCGMFPVLTECVPSEVAENIGYANTSMVLANRPCIHQQR